METSNGAVAVSGRASSAASPHISGFGAFWAALYPAGPRFGNEKHERGVKILCLHSPEKTKEPSCATVGLSRLHVQVAEISFGECDMATVTAGKIRGEKR